MTYLALAAILLSIAAIWRAAGVFHKYKTLTEVNRKQRKVIDALMKANERESKLTHLFKDIEKAKSAKEYEDLYSSIVSS